jgi:tRNA A37 threonylcarbamoyladenosine synthetase subunit TsaC/SUA5/YrdC
VLPFINPDKTYLRQGLMTQPVRLPEGKEINQLLKQTGPLLTSSANLASKPPANNIEEAQKYFGDEVNFYVDGGNLSDRKPSTIIRVIDDAVEVLREGAVKINTNE